ncbi:MAG: DUF1800 domain-containing protein [Alphaproteobacteria bacterium]|nr:DUF1800 domain-containing protein [Alphaproteobacteria bacterium]MDP6515466.1 DUF1800 domain-containing protein [Alphaproteobacteria bacterium]
MNGFGRRAALAIAAVMAISLASANPARSGAGPESWIGDLTPITAAEWTADRAAHLLERAGFGGTPEQVARLAALTPAQAVAWLVDFETVVNDHLAPFDESGIFDPGMEPFPRSRAEAVRWARADGESMGVKVKPGGDRPYQYVVNKYFYYLRSDRLEAHRLGQWWANRMQNTARPFEEKLALFWHGHFATTDAKVRDYRKMLNQLELFWTLGATNYRQLMVAVAQDPGMLVFLDAGENVKGSPNENFAREILELFTIGIGNYTETDIREAARAFTGWTNDRLQFVVDTARHDDGPKTFMGRTGNFDGVDIIDIVLDQPATARFIAAKLYRFFAAENAPPALIDRLAAIFRDNDYDMKPLLRAMFLSRDFYGPAVVATQIKSPVQLVVSTYRKLGLRAFPGVPDFHAVTDALGQKLLYPPNVAGWEGGRSWITPATLVERGNFAKSVLFPPVGEFRAPERALTKIYRDVGAKLDVGLDISTATVEGASTGNMMSMADMMVAVSDEEYNTRYGAYHGTVMAMKRVKPIPRDPPAVDLVGMVQDADLRTTSQVVDHFLTRLLRAPLRADHRASLIAFLDRELGTNDIAFAISYLDEPLRALVHLIMSTPEYQLS